MVICPGGGYGHLATDKEGHAVALWFQSQGVSGFVLQYRLGSSGYHYPIEIDDGRRALRWVRQNAKRYGVDPLRVGMTGFSAGGHLASTVGTHYDAGNPAAADSVDGQSCRPDFLILIYPVITMDAAHTDGGTRLNLIGANPSADLVALLSNEKHVTAQTPPAFLGVGLNDGLCQNSQAFRDSCQAHGVPSELHLFADGPHGFGLADGKYGAPAIPATAAWPSLALAWLKAQKLLTPVPLDVEERSGDAYMPVTGKRASAGFFLRMGNGIRNLLGREAHP
jgi:acetyl esterase/lipase